VTFGRPSVSHGCEAGCGEAAVAGGDALEVLQPAEQPLDGVAASVELQAEAALVAEVRPGPDIRYRAVCLDRALGAIHIEAPSAITRAPWATASISASPLRNSAVSSPGETKRDRLAGLVCRSVDLAGPPVTSVDVVENADGLEVATAQAALGGSCRGSLVGGGVSISCMA